MSELGMFCTVARTIMKEYCPDITDEGLLYVNEIIKSTHDLRQRDIDALAAQVEALKNMLIHGYKLDLQMRGVDELEIPKFILNFEKELPTPADCLAQVKADAVEKFATYVFAGNDYLHFNLNEYAKQYVERIRQGATE